MRGQTQFGVSARAGRCTRVPQSTAETVKADRRQKLTLAVQSTSRSFETSPKMGVFVWSQKILPQFRTSRRTVFSRASRSYFGETALREKPPIFLGQACEALRGAGDRVGADFSVCRRDRDKGSNKSAPHLSLSHPLPRRCCATSRSLFCHPSIMPTVVPKHQSAWWKEASVYQASFQDCRSQLRRLIDFCTDLPCFVPRFERGRCW